MLGSVFAVQQFAILYQALDTLVRIQPLEIALTATVSVRSFDRLALGMSNVHNRQTVPTAALSRLLAYVGCPLDVAAMTLLPQRIGMILQMVLGPFSSFMML